jgi:hypothetical protein
MSRLRDLMTQGCWYCDHCLRSVPLADSVEPDERGLAHCPKCRHQTARWIPPVFTPEEYDAPPSGVRNY